MQACQAGFSQGTGGYSLRWPAPCGSESHTEPRCKGAVGQYALDTIPVGSEASGHPRFLQIEKGDKHIEFEVKGGPTDIS